MDNKTATPMNDFYDAYEDLLRTFRASGDDPNLAYCRMVGALKVIIPFGVDTKDLTRITENLRASAKRQTFEVLSKETF